MKIYPGVSASNVNTYHHSNSLLFQFLLTTFMDAHDVISSLEKTVREAEQTDYSPRSRILGIHRPIVEGSLSKLTGPTGIYARLISWDFNESLLVKLRSYCALFLKNSEGDKKDLTTLHRYSEKMLSNSLEASNTMESMHTTSVDFLNAVNKLFTNRDLFSKLLPKLISQFKNDENVIFCVLQQKKRLDRIYGDRFIGKLFSKMYPEGLQHLQQMLVTKYTERGFDQIPLVVTERIAELESLL